MLNLIIHQNKINNISQILQLCPFNALEEIDGKVEIARVLVERMLTCQLVYK